MVIFEMSKFGTDLDERLLLRGNFSIQRQRKLVSAIKLIEHMGAEVPYSFKDVSRGPLYGKLTTRHQ